MQEKIKLVPVDVKNRPDWHKEKVYPANKVIFLFFAKNQIVSARITKMWCVVGLKVPALEHNNAVKGESLDLIKYINDNFQGPSLYPDVRFSNLEKK